MITRLRLRWMRVTDAVRVVHSRGDDVCRLPISLMCNGSTEVGYPSGVLYSVVDVECLVNVMRQQGDQSNKCGKDVWCPGVMLATACVAVISYYYRRSTGWRLRLVERVA